MQGLNITKNSENLMGEIYRCCDNPQITYLAPVNINIDERTIGTVAVSYTHLTLPTTPYV